MSKVWGDFTAVDNISLEASAGEFTVLLGPSGCGKSTILRLIAGLESPTNGQIFIGDHEVTDAAPSERNLSMVFQNYALFPHLKVSENILFGLKVRKTPKKEREERLKKTADMLGVSELLDRRPNQLSGGQQQRIALGRAIIAEKPVCLMDEPLSNLDAKLRREMRLEIRAIQKKLNITMVYVTHDQTEAMSMADRVILLRKGRIEQNATPEEIYQRPATIYVARFIGTPPMNIINVKGLGESRTQLKGLCHPSVVNGAHEDKSIGIRPEDIEITDNGSGLPATVIGLEFLGSDSIVDCQAGSEHVVVRVHRRLKIEAGKKIHLSWPLESAHHFSTSTGLRLENLN